MIIEKRIRYNKITTKDILDASGEKSLTDAAKKIGVTRQAFTTWKKEGISAYKWEKYFGKPLERKGEDNGNDKNA